MTKTHPKNPLKVTDLTLRDGHQSLLATRLRTEDMVPIAEEMDKVGFYSMEVWGGGRPSMPPTDFWARTPGSGPGP